MNAPNRGYRQRSAAQNARNPHVNTASPVQTGFGSRPPANAVPEPVRIPISSFPKEAQEALRLAWDVDGTGMVSVEELTAGATGGESARAARVKRTEALEEKRRASRSANQQLGPNTGPGRIHAIGRPDERNQEPAAGSKGYVPPSYARYESMPGDIAAFENKGTAEGKPIWERMAAIIRARRLDVRILMDAHDRQNKGFIDMDVFRRSLCYAFGNEWINLSMTSAEFDEVAAPYDGGRFDLASRRGWLTMASAFPDRYLTRKPNLRGEPEAFVFWQKFAADLQALADTRVPTDNFMNRLAAVEARERVAEKLLREYAEITR
jgi:hypothetical protein